MEISRNQNYHNVVIVTRLRGPNILNEEKNKDINTLYKNLKYTIFTSGEQCDALIMSSKPVKGKSINDIFKTKSDLINFSQTIINETSLLEYDKVYNEIDSLDNIYNDLISPLVSSLFLGKNSSVVLFGPRDGGKSFLLRGGGIMYSGVADVGILSRCITDCLNRVKLERQMGKNIKCFISVYQVFGGEIRDLSSKDINNIMIEKYYDEENEYINTNLVGLKKNEIRNKNDYDLCIKEAIQNRKNLSQFLRVNDLKRKSSLIISLSLEGTFSSQIDFVELPSSDLALCQKTNAPIVEDIEATFGSIAENILASCQGTTAKKESALSLCLKKSINKKSNVTFINCVIPYEYPLKQSKDALQFTSCLRNQVINQKVNLSQDFINNNNTFPTSDTSDNMQNSGTLVDYTNKILGNRNAKHTIESYNGNTALTINSKYYGNKNKTLDINDLENRGSKTPILRHNRFNIEKYMNNSVDLEDKRKFNIKQYDVEDNKNNRSALIGCIPKLDEEKIKISPQELKLQRLEASLKQLEEKSCEMTQRLEDMRNMRKSVLNSQANLYDTQSSALFGDNNMDKNFDVIKKEYATLKSDNIIYREDIARLTEINRNLEEELNVQRSNNIELANCNESLLQEKNKLENMLKESRQINEKNKFSEKNLEQIYQERIYMQNKIGNLELENKKLNEEKNKFEIDFKVLSARFEELKTRYDTMESEYSRTKINHNEEVNKIEEKVDAFLKEIDKLQRENCILRKENESQRIEISTSIKEEENQKERADNLQKKNDELNKRLNEIESNFNELKYAKENNYYKNIMNEERARKCKLENRAKIVNDLQMKIQRYKNERLKSMNDDFVDDNKLKFNL